MPEKWEVLVPASLFLFVLVHSNNLLVNILSIIFVEQLLLPVFGY